MDGQEKTNNVTEVNESAMDEESVEKAKALSHDKNFQKAIEGSHFFEDIAKKFHQMPKVVALAAGLWIASVKGAFGAEKVEEVGAPKLPTATLMAKAEAKGLSGYENKDEDQMFLEKASKAVDFARQNMGKMESMKGDLGMKDSYGDDWLGLINEAVVFFSNEKDDVSRSIAIKSSNKLKRAVDTAIKVAILEKDTIESLETPGVISASADYGNDADGLK